MYYYFQIIKIINNLFSNNKKFMFIAAAGDPNAWRLGRIEETDHETPV